MNKNQNASSGAHQAQPKRTIPVPRIVKPQPSASVQPPPKIHPPPHPAKPGQPLKPAQVVKATQQKHVPWLTTGKIPRNAIPRIP